MVVHPDGSWTVVEIKSFPMLDGSADAAKVGAAARQAAVYVLALERVAARLGAGPEGRAGDAAHAEATPLTVPAPSDLPTGALATPAEAPAETLGTPGAQDGIRTRPPEVRHTVLLVCPKDFSNLPTASAVDVRKQRSVTRRQLDRLTRIEDIADLLPEGTCFSPDLPTADLTAAVESVPATYAPECLSACELAFHCRDHSRAEGAVTSLGRSLRAELGGLTTVDDVLSAARGETGDPTDPAVAALRRAAALRAEALGSGARPGAEPLGSTEGLRAEASGRAAC